MSEIGRLWSRRLRGYFTVAEHAIARELGEYHNQQTNLSFPAIETLGGDYECTRAHVTQCLNRLETWGLIWRKEFYLEGKKGDPVQTSNRFILNFDRHFPDPKPEGRRTRDKNLSQKPRPYDKRDLAALAGAEKGRRLLRMIHQVLRSDATLVMGVKEAFFEQRNHRNGVTFARLWVSIESETHLMKFRSWQTELRAALKKESPLQFEIETLPLFYPTRNNRAGDLKI